ncbi:MAG: 30S ribosomal protein S11 [Candidatus Collierbacteria bacterium GW2011_GWB1_45_35]|uniref:Small ribosomal subunit protein uS11 n=2 Tax=Candidatus Collieribacteriota TaxID=1752725 RepID=A0A0G1NNC7_9BACT|nr:MAG: 30S ribosomal protein S11 [Microgenomates group bacterium GW2011_GWC1_44_23]KKT85714.1 MAG: 30S ribosomal protein S11 [Candidatus Collierbacteria bacterium GW2011_GWA2_44_99]KKT96197.1 MAG: 30S ribosomal protein S11 [Candidatus Collierbacteria bacterium GW2011_GWA1_45_15]KKU01237.1 MAG: 30S ribosomal protein S11 [Candidatus Collierbacteria bacterium GW2011_GWB2_45_17]KKU05336.1 MAG: 30S ribosomal protein S11 [Candidatus Collierbacteria bacterium GW2011_GWB1_45_35]KKU08483.1 MAG: 30S ri
MPEEKPIIKPVLKNKKASAIHFKSGQGKMYVKSTFNTTYVTFTDTTGNTVCWSSAGTCGFKGAKRSTPFAATTIIEEGLRKAKTLGLTNIDVYLKGPGPGKDAALRVLKTSGAEINMLADTTPIPHNGCRPRKHRRV